MWNGGYWNGGPVGGWILFPIAVVIALRLFGGMMAIRGGWFNAGPPNDPPASGSALEALRQRYAHGEIDQQAYETKRALLGPDSSRGGVR